MYLLCVWKKVKRLALFVSASQKWFQLLFKPGIKQKQMKELVCKQTGAETADFSLSLFALISPKPGRQKKKDWLTQPAEAFGLILWRGRRKLKEIKHAGHLIWDSLFINAYIYFVYFYRRRIPNNKANSKKKKEADPLLTLRIKND